MRIFDSKFQDNKLKYIAQTIMGAMAVTAALFIFDIVNQPVIIASLGASGFVAFSAPHNYTAQPRHLIGGYIIGITLGCLLHYFTTFPLETYAAQKIVHLAACAIAFALAMFFMAITNTEHAPAAGVTIGFVINDWTIFTILFVMLGIIVISSIQTVLKKWMIDLV